MAKRMEDIGVRYLIVTDIYKDGTMNGPNLVMLDKVNRAVSCNIIASGGVSNLKDIVRPQRPRRVRRDCGQIHLYESAGLNGGHHRQPAPFRQIVQVQRRRGRPSLSATSRNRSSSVHRAGGLHKRSAHAGIHEPRIHGENAGDRLHVVLQPQPPNAVEQRAQRAAIRRRSSACMPTATTIHCS